MPRSASSNTGAPTDLTFTGQRDDTGLGLMYYGARYYDPLLGQFTQPDPLSVDGTNHYAYVRNNPVSLTDPTGLCATVIDGSYCTYRRTTKKATAARKRTQRTIARITLDSVRSRPPANLNMDAVGSSLRQLQTGADDKRNVSAESNYAKRILALAVISNVVAEINDGLHSRWYGPPSCAKSRCTIQLTPPIERLANPGNGPTGSEMAIAEATVDQHGGGSMTMAGMFLGRNGAVNVIPSSGRTFVGTPRGTVYDIPEGWAPRVADNGRGIVYQRPGATGNADMIRIMDPTAKYPNGYVRYYNHNQHGQPLDVYGRPGPGSATHIPQDYQGPWPGWPG